MSEKKRSWKEETAISMFDNILFFYILQNVVMALVGYSFYKVGGEFTTGDLAIYTLFPSALVYLTIQIGHFADSLEESIPVEFHILKALRWVAPLIGVLLAILLLRTRAHYSELWKGRN